MWLKVGKWQEVAKSGKKWLKVDKKVGKVRKSKEKWRKVAKSGERGEKWRKVRKSGEKLEKVAVEKSGGKW